MKNKNANSSWENVNKWYQTLVGEKGHYYHQRVIFPKLKKLLELDSKKPKAILDLACGEGVFSRILPKTATYVGCDLSPSLIRQAKKLSKNPAHQFFVADVTKPLRLPDETFDSVVFILALQDIKQADRAIQNASKALKKGGTLAIVINHPCFRIPRQTSWEIDEGQNLQYRRINHYLTPLEIPIQTRPSKGEKSPQVFSYHRPLSLYFQWLAKYGFCTLGVEEWISDKKSTGKKAKMENRARQEFPLFMAILARISRYTHRKERDRNEEYIEKC